MEEVLRNKTEMKNIVKNTDYNTVYCYHQDHAGFVPHELVENADGLVNIVSVSYTHLQYRILLLHIPDL